MHYSAGRLQPAPTPDDDEDFPVWPEGKQGGRRRWPGMEHLDLVSEQPIPWDVRLPRRVSARHPERDLEHLRDALDADEAVASLRAKLEAGENRVDAVFRFVIHARTHEEALNVVLAIEQRSMDQVPYPVEEMAHAEGGTWVADPTGWNPMDEIRPTPRRE